MTEDTLSPDALAALQRQEEPAFTRLVQRHQSVILGLCQSRGLRGADIDDAAAEVFAAVYRGLPRFRGDSALSTWIYRIAVRIISRVRARYPAAPPPSSVEAAAPGAGPAEVSQQHEQHAALWSAVAALEPRQALAVELFYRRGWSVEQVAQIMECPSATVKTLLFRARDALRPVLQRQEIVP